MGTEYGQFGKSVGISGSYIIVGAFGENSNQTTITNTDGVASSDNSSSMSGAAYVFKRDSSGDWFQDAYFKASNADNSDYFDWPVAISGSFIARGAYQESSNQTSINNTDGSASVDNKQGKSRMKNFYLKPGLDFARGGCGRMKFMLNRIFVHTMIASLTIHLITLSLLANTERDIGPMPELSRPELNRWILFYTNIQRVSHNLPPVGYDPILEKAADWIAEYCALKLKNLSHTVQVPGMRDPGDRIRHFGGNYFSYGENLTLAFRSNMENVSYYPRRDEQGEYKNFGNHTIYWRNERQLAYQMLAEWMKSPGHRANILKKNFTTLEAGSSPGTYRSTHSAYGAQVFTTTPTVNLEGLKISEDKKFFTYESSLQPICLLVHQDEPPKQTSLQQTEDGFTCPISDKPGKRYVALEGSDTGIWYPALKL